MSHDIHLFYIAITKTTIPDHSPVHIQGSPAKSGG